MLKQPWLRFIEGPEGGAQSASTEQAEPSPSESDESTDDNASGESEVDYKAKYEAMKAHSRQWESKAKANLEAAKKLKEIEDEGKSEVDKLTERLAESEKDKAALKADLDRMTIAAKFGLSAEDAAMFLHGDTETMSKQAETLAERGRSPRKAEAPNQGRGVGSGLRLRLSNGPSRCWASKYLI